MTREPLAVFIGGRYAARIDHTARWLRLVYGGDYAESPDATPLSLSLPIAAGEVAGARVSGWLDGLLPGNENVRADWASRYRARSVEPFDLLSTPIGLDCPGAVQTCPVSESGDIERRRGGVEWLSDERLSEIVDEIVRSQRWARRSRLGGYSLAGAQGKTALCRRGDQWGEPWGVVPTTHILKPSMRDLTDQALNEHLCLAAARYCGLAAARSEALRIGEHIVVAVVRYDRVATEDGTISRVHQEDFHQACGSPTESIYQRAGAGHSLTRLARLLGDHSTDPDGDRRRFFDALVFNWVIANTDAHAKNYSLLLGPRGAARLAPLYDLWSYLPYDPDYIRAHTLAMSPLEDKRIIAAENPAAWQAAARAVGLAPADAPERAATLAGAVAAAFERAVDELPAHLRSSPLAGPLAKQVAARVAACRASLATPAVGLTPPPASSLGVDV